MRPKLLLPSSLVSALALLCNPAWAADAAIPAPLSVDEATADAVAWGPNLSPSGRYLALLRSKDDLNVIVVADLQDDAAKPLVHPVPHGVVKWIAWASDDRLLFATTFWADKWGKPMTFAQLKYTKGIRVVRLMAMGRDGKNLTMLFADNKEALQTVDLTRVTDFLPNDPRHIIAPAWQYGSYSLFKVDVFTGASKLVAEGTAKTFLWFTDNDGYPALRIDRNWLDTLAYVYARKGPGDVEPEQFEWEKIFTIPLNDADNKAAPDFYPLYAGPEPNSYYVAARPDGADTTGIYLYDFVAKKYLKTLATEPGIDIENAFVDYKTREFLGVRYYADRKITRLVDSKLQAHLNALDKYFGGEVDVYLGDYDRARENWLLFTIGPRDRGSWHIYRLKDKFVREIAHWRPVLDTKRLGTTRVLRYRARDGLEIRSYLTTPPKAPKDGPPPLIMLPHGGPEVRDYYEFDDLVQLLASRGYQVFQPNFRGSSGFGKRFADAGKRQWGGAMQNDLTDGFEFLVKNGYAARDRACIVGFSYGGYAALAGATLTPGLYRCAVSVAGISDLPKQMKSEKRKARNDEETWAYVKRQIGDPDADEAMLEARSPARLARAAEIPILLIHGKHDGVVPIEQSEMMEEALREAGKDVHFIELADSGHTPDGEDLKRTYRSLLEFLDKHLPAVTVQPATAAEPPG